MKKYILLSFLAALSLASKAQVYVFTTVAGGNGAGSAANQLNAPEDVFLDAAGNIYVADYRNNRIQKFAVGSDSATAGLTVAGGNGAGSAANQLNLPTGIYVDSSGNLYVADQRNGRIQKFPAGSDSATAGVTVAAAGLSQPIAVFVDGTGAIYVSDGTNQRIQRFAAGSGSATAGATVAGGNGNGSSPNQLSQPNGIYVDSAGNIYVADYFNNRVQKFPAGSDSTTAGVTVAGGNRAGTGADQLNGPTSVYLDHSGRLYVSDEVNNRVQLFPAGSDSATDGMTVAGDTTAGSGMDRLNGPNGLYIDGRGSLYIADGGNNRIQKRALNTTGLSNIANANSMNLYPNPNSGAFILQSSGDIGKEYVVNDMLGRSVAQGLITSDRQNIDLATAHLSSGPYLFEIKGSKAIRLTIDN